ncbi:MAG TPA: DNA-binding transcriptional regulator [Opitutaceae bacterium]
MAGPPGRHRPCRSPPATSRSLTERCSCPMISHKTVTPRTFTGPAASNGTRRKVLVAASTPPGECLRGVIRYARDHEWHLVMDMVFTGSLPRGWRGDGILALIPYHSELLAHIQRLGAPCVAFTGTEQPETLPRIDVDHRLIGRLAADHLLERAHRSFAWAPFLNDAANRERFAAYQARLEEYGYACRVLSAFHNRIGPYWQDNWTEHRRTLIGELKLLPSPTAIFAFNDCVAAEIVDACCDAGLSVPDDLAVLGVGDSIVCETSAVPLSSIDDDMEAMGYRAAAILDTMMDGAEAPTEIERVSPKSVMARLSTDIAAVKDPRIARALSYIAEHYPDPMLTVPGVATALGMSRRNLERGFRDTTGRTIYEHIVHVRMQEASRLLKTHPRAKSAEIAVLVGIAESGTFFRTFRRHFGMSPKAYRDLAPPSDESRNLEASLRPVVSRPGSVRQASSRVRSTAVA